MIEHHLQRIATALEAIAQALNPGFVVVDDGVAHIQAPSPQPTLTNPPLAWFHASGGATDAVSDTPGDGTDMIAHVTDKFAGMIDDEDDPRHDLVERMTGQTTWEWLGITPPASRKRQKYPDHREHIRVKRGARGAEVGNTRAGQCGRCGRPGRRRLNNKPFCHDCQHEPEWDE